MGLMEMQILVDCEVALTEVINDLLVFKLQFGSCLHALPSLLHEPFLLL